MYFHYPAHWFIYVAAGIFLLAYIVYFFRINLIAKKIRSSIRARVYIKFVLRSLIFSLVLFALLGPSFGDSKKEVVIHSKNILFVLDVSLSMDTRDVSPSRLEKARTIIHNIVDQNVNDTYGLMLYASGASLQCPFTTDDKALLLFTQTATTSAFDHTGTNTGDALREAKVYTANYKKNGDAKPTLMVLLSDGEGINEQTLHSLDDKRDLFSNISIIGIGTESGARIPFQKKYKTDASGNYVVSHLNRETLQELSKSMDGLYYEVSDTKDEEPALYNAIRNFKGKEESASKLVVAGNKFYYFLTAALILILIDVLFTVKTVII